MKNAIFIFIILELFLYSCTKKKEAPAVYDIQIIKTKEIILEESDRNYTFAREQLVEIDGSNVLVIIANSEKLSFYDLDNGAKIREIPADQERILKSFKYINKDSIFLFYDVYYYSREYEMRNPGMFQLIDYDGNLKQVYKYNIDTVELKNRNLDIKTILPPSQKADNIPVVGSNTFFSTYFGQIGDVGTKEFMENRLPFLMRYNIPEQKFYLSKHNSFPYIEEGIYYPTSWSDVHYSISGNNLPLVRYNYSSDIFEWDYENDEIITYSLKSRLIDSVMPMAKPSMYYNNNLEHIYSGTYYDPYRELYFSCVYYNDEFYDCTGGLWNIIIANKDFEYLGELYCNKNWPCFYTKNDVLDIHPKNDSVIQVDYLKLVKTKRNYNDFIDSCRNDLEIRKQKISDITKGFDTDENYIIKFLNSRKKITNENYRVVTFYIADGCMGCNEAVYTEIAGNKEALEKNPFYLIVTGNSIGEAYGELGKYNLQDFKNLVIDSTGIIRRLTKYDGLRNPRLTIVENNSVVHDSIYTAFDIESVLIPKMLKGLNYIEHNGIIYEIIY
ncbi:MAG: DUF4221 domain-containing protein [Bacteroidales bacterium]|jgi:hypothetical protein|nr:DUF4221 domain-containing protein [Bacteroidales bacterium]